MLDCVQTCSKPVLLGPSPSPLRASFLRALASRSIWHHSLGEEVMVRPGEGSYQHLMNPEGQQPESQSTSSDPKHRLVFVKLCLLFRWQRSWAGMLRWGEPPPGAPTPRCLLEIVLGPVMDSSSILHLCGKTGWVGLGLFYQYSFVSLMAAATRSENYVLARAGTLTQQAWTVVAIHSFCEVAQCLPSGITAHPVGSDVSYCYDWVQAPKAFCALAPSGANAVGASGERLQREKAWLGHT